jgi:hypothetical protein
MEEIIINSYLKVSTKNVQTITTNLITQFGKIAYVFKPLSQWVRFFLISFKCFKNTSEKCQLDYNMVFICSSQPQEPNTTDNTKNS